MPENSNPEKITVKAACEITGLDKSVIRQFCQEHKELPEIAEKKGTKYFLSLKHLQIWEQQNRFCPNCKKMKPKNCFQEENCLDCTGGTKNLISKTETESPKPDTNPVKPDNAKPDNTELVNAFVKALRMQPKALPAPEPAPEDTTQNQNQIQALENHITQMRAELEKKEADHRKEIETVLAEIPKKKRKIYGKYRQGNLLKLPLCPRARKQIVMSLFGLTPQALAELRRKKRKWL